MPPAIVFGGWTVWALSNNPFGDSANASRIPGKGFGSFSIFNT